VVFAGRIGLEPGGARRGGLGWRFDNYADEGEKKVREPVFEQYTLRSDPIEWDLSGWEGTVEIDATFHLDYWLREGRSEIWEEAGQFPFHFMMTIEKMEA
jgi:hypothetical protein